MKAYIHRKLQKTNQKIPDIPTYEEGMFKENKTSPLLEKVLEIHKSKINEDLSNIDSNIEKINEKILDAAAHNLTYINIYFKKFNETYIDTATAITADYRYRNDYEYYINTDLSKDQLIGRIKRYYEYIGFDVLDMYRNGEKRVEISWTAKIKIN